MLYRHIVKQMLCAFSELKQEREEGKNPSACTFFVLVWIFFAVVVLFLGFLFWFWLFCSVFPPCFFETQMALWEHSNDLKTSAFWYEMLASRQKGFFFSLFIKSVKKLWYILKE